MVFSVRLSKIGVILTLILTLSASYEAVAADCVGDCDDDGRVRIHELVTAIAISLSGVSLDECGGLDTDSNGLVTIDEIIGAVRSALCDCVQDCLVDQPDLIAISFDSQDPYSGTVCVRNNGRFPAGPFAVRVEDAQFGVDMVQFESGLGARMSGCRRVAVGFLPFSGSFVEIFIDPDQLIDEEDERNNTAKFFRPGDEHHP